MRSQQSMLAIVAGLGVMVAAGWLVATASMSAQAPQADLVSVSIFDNHFDPKAIVVPVGTTVVWVNKGQRPHTVTSQSGIWEDSGRIPPGGDFSVTFDVPGTYFYVCKLHMRDMMRGKVIVKKTR